MFDHFREFSILFDHFRSCSIMFDHFRSPTSGNDGAILGSCGSSFWVKRADVAPVPKPFWCHFGTTLNARWCDFGEKLASADIHQKPIVFQWRRNARGGRKNNENHVAAKRRQDSQDPSKITPKTVKNCFEIGSNIGSKMMSEMVFKLILFNGCFWSQNGSQNGANNGTKMAPKSELAPKSCPRGAPGDQNAPHK